MSPGRFVFNTNRCVGCMACMAGCMIENQTTSQLPWRQVSTFNPLGHPGLPLFHFSLACNHCEEAPCMKNCPAVAYTRDPETGLIIHHAEACIGCKYCTWACPYDAPKFNSRTGVIEKCTFCADRLENEQVPACVAACPVDALGYEENNPPMEKQLIPGFSEQGIKPSIRLIPFRKERSAPAIINEDDSPPPIQEAKKWISKPISKVLLHKEWMLILFTLIIPWMTAWLAGVMAQTVTMSAWLFAAAGLFALALTLLHLGKKQRAWRAILHLNKSWLSREVLSSSLFIGFGFFYLMLPYRMLGYLAILFGIISLISIDMVYSLLKRKEKTLVHSSLVVFTATLYFGLFTGNIFLIGFSLTFKAGLYVFRKMSGSQPESVIASLIALVRLSLLIAPILWFAFASESPIPYWIIIGVILIGEIIDRIEFYYESEITTPESEIFSLYQQYEQQES